MTKNDFKKIVGMIKAYYPNINIFATDETVMLWYEELKELTTESCVAAIRKHINTSPKVITIYDIKTNAIESVDDWGSAWDRVLKAVGKYGMYNETEALESLDEQTRIAVKGIGWKQLCKSESPDVVRGQFRSAYETTKKKTEDNRKIPQAVFELISNNKLIGENK